MLIVSYVSRLGPFWGFKIFGLSIFSGGFQKNEFWFEDFVDILGRSSQNLTILEGLFLSMPGSSLRSIYRIGIFWGLLKFQIFLGCLIFLIFLW